MKVTKAPIFPIIWLKSQLLPFGGSKAMVYSDPQIGPRSDGEINSQTACANFLDPVGLRCNMIQAIERE